MCDRIVVDLLKMPPHYSHARSHPVAHPHKPLKRDYHTEDTIEPGSFMFVS